MADGDIIDAIWAEEPGLQIRISQLSNGGKLIEIVEIGNNVPVKVLSSVALIHHRVQRLARALRA